MGGKREIDIMEVILASSREKAGLSVRERGEGLPVEGYPFS